MSTSTTEAIVLRTLRLIDFYVYRNKFIKYQEPVVRGGRASGCGSAASGQFDALMSVYCDSFIASGTISGANVGALPGEGTVVARNGTGSRREGFARANFNHFMGHNLASICALELWWNVGKQKTSVLKKY